MAANVRVCVRTYVRPLNGSSFTYIQRCTYVRVIQYCNNTAFCHANHFQDDIVMVIANLLKLLISFSGFRQEYNRRFEERHDNIISESCFRCIFLAAICNHYGTLHLILPKSFHLPKCPIKPQFPHHSIVALCLPSEQHC